ncbi:hypothetical protein IEQ34_022837 [Dendrobium chrysotoxum]|uniref:Uncharacterized protein n=1 Tax=Dendrobium chrysotoxum TaxID=161865 RepID=A0AAV7FYU7_DENCH|nr:hypothetical protein IEQ34_022837 [Dendrobium chrysotoxum]
MFDAEGIIIEGDNINVIKFFQDVMNKVDVKNVKSEGDFGDPIWWTNWIPNLVEFGPCDHLISRKLEYIKGNTSPSYVLVRGSPKVGLQVEGEDHLLEFARDGGLEWL